MELLEQANAGQLWHVIVGDQQVVALQLQCVPGGGAIFGGTGGPLDDYVGDVTKYVLRKAGCRVILTAPAS